VGADPGAQADQIAGDHADEDREHAQHALAPYLQGDHQRQDPEAESGTLGEPRRRGMLGIDPEHQPHAQGAEDNADLGDAEPGNLGGEKCPQARYHLRQQQLDDPGEHGHAADQRDAAGFGRLDAARKIGCGKHEGQQEARTEIPAGKALQQRTNPEPDDRQAQQIAQLVGLEPARQPDKEREYQDRQHHGDVLQRVQKGQRGRYFFGRAINQSARFLLWLLAAGRGPAARESARRICHEAIRSVRSLAIRRPSRRPQIDRWAEHTIPKSLQQRQHKFPGATNRIVLCGPSHFVPRCRPSAGRDPLIRARDVERWVPACVGMTT
jgi:hypothetical protein